MANKVSDVTVKKLGLLRLWRDRIERAVRGGQFGPRVRAEDLVITPIPGPRAGVLLIIAGMGAEVLLKGFSGTSKITLRSTVPWDFTGAPIAFEDRRYIRVEAGWPPELAEDDIPLRSIGENPHRSDQWIAGRDEYGATIAPTFKQASHWLIAGATGTGKTTTMRSAIAQMARKSGEIYTQRGVEETRFVLIDGKMGEGLGDLHAIPMRVGPLAWERTGAFKALGWVMAEMKKRYDTGRRLKMTGNPAQVDAEGKVLVASDYDLWYENLVRVVVVIDEVQTFTGRGDFEMIDAVSAIAAQGRAAKINLILGTQHPVNDVLGSPTIKSNVTGRIVLHTNSAKASEVALGQPEPRSDRLLLNGDAYVAILPGSIARVQIAYMTNAEISAIPKVAPWFEEWPEVGPEIPEDAFTSQEEGEDLSSSQDGRGGGRGRFAEFDPNDFAVTLISRFHGEGRTRLSNRLSAAGQLATAHNTEKLRKLMNRATETLLYMKEAGYTLQETDIDDSPIEGDTDDE